MKSTILFLLLVTFGTIVVSADIGSGLNECYQTTNYYDSACPDHEAFIDCLKKLIPEDDEEKTRLEDAIAYSQTELNRCPGFKGSIKCIDTEVTNCMADFYKKQLSRSKDVCDEIPKARDCLDKLNNVCNTTTDVVSIHAQHLTNVDTLCSSGLYDDGPCSASKSRACTLDVLAGNDGDGPSSNYNCAPAVVSSAQKCLNALKRKCQILTLQHEIESELAYLKNIFCPSN